MSGKRLISEMPEIFFGTYKLEQGSETVEAVSAAIDAGFRGIDTAYAYGNDFYSGKAIKNSTVSRDRLFVTNKAMKDCRTKDAVMDNCRQSLKLMKLDYFDLYLLHWPCPTLTEGWRDINADMWAGMEALQREGLVRHIGMSNFSVTQLEALLEDSDVKPEVNQIECHPGYCLWETAAWCTEHDICMQGWRPFGQNVEPLRHPDVLRVAEKNGCTAAQVCLAWVRQHGLIPVCRSKSPERIRENLASLHVNLDEADMKLLDEMERCGWSSLDPDHPPR